MSNMPVHNEKSTVKVTAVFRDDDEVLVVPTAAEYRIHGGPAETEVLATTPISPLASSVELVITSAQNACLTANQFERRRVTVEFDYGSPSQHGTGEYVYLLDNLRGVSA